MWGLALSYGECSASQGIVVNMLMVSKGLLLGKVSTRLYFIRQLKKSHVATRELLLFYITCIRSILEYGSPVFHRALPSYLSEDLERLQKRAMKIIYPELAVWTSNTV